MGAGSSTTPACLAPEQIGPAPPAGTCAHVCARRRGAGDRAGPRGWGAERGRAGPSGAGNVDGRLHRRHVRTHVRAPVRCTLVGAGDCAGPRDRGAPDRGGGGGGEWGGNRGGRAGPRGAGNVNGRLRLPARTHTCARQRVHFSLVCEREGSERERERERGQGGRERERKRDRERERKRDRGRDWQSRPGPGAGPGPQAGYLPPVLWPGAPTGRVNFK